MRVILVLVLISLIPAVIASCDKNQIDINSASIKELDEIVWVGPTTAQKIIDSRPFEDLDDLTKVGGIGEKKLLDIKSEGKACVEKTDDEKEEIEEIEAEQFKEPEINNSGSLLENKKEMLDLNPIVLNEIKQEDRIEKELVYESKNSKILRYSPYAFSIFLIVVIGFLIKER